MILLYKRRCQHQFTYVLSQTPNYFLKKTEMIKLSLYNVGFYNVGWGRIKFYSVKIMGCNKKASLVQIQQLADQN